MTEPIMTDEQREALDIAHDLVRAGIPVFAAYPCPDTCRTPGHGRTEYHLPLKWQETTIEDSLDHLKRWRPGMALAAVGGHAADFLDTDTQHNGEIAEKEIRERGGWPRTFGTQSTPTGGKHDVISPLGEARVESFAPGVDYQGGQEDGDGRAFIYIAPTVKRSKITGEPGTYRWTQRPDLEQLAEFAGSDDSGQHVRDLVIAKHAAARGKSAPLPSAAPVPASAPGVGGPFADMDNPFVTSSQLTFSPSVPGAAREFTPGEAEQYIAGARERLRGAKIGEIEGRANDLAVTISHFVPEFWTHEDAFALLVSDLGKTAYDPNHPAAAWTADKFHPVIDGARVRDPWRAVRRAVVLTREAPPEPATRDEVEALLAEMLTAKQVIERPAPKPLIKGFLSLDTEAWLIGAPGSKKSFVALDMGAHVALGMPWRGCRVTAGLVVMIVAEGAGGAGKRLAAWEKEHGRELGDRLLVLPRPVQAADKHAWSVLVEACRRLGPVMVTVDTQARVTVGLEENSATDMGYYVEAVGAIRQATGACVFTIHHTGRAGGDARGSSAIDGAQYTELKVDVGAGAMRGMLVTEKQKDIEQAEPLPLAFRSVVVGVDEDGEDVTSLVLCEPDAFEDAAGPGSETQETVRDVIRDSQADWLMQAAPNSPERRRLLQVLADIGQEEGLTLASAMQSVAERWYAGKISKAAGTPGVSASVLKRGWADFLKDGTGPDGEALIVSSGGMRKRIHPGVRMS
jgi:hypothetical protein